MKVLSLDPAIGITGYAVVDVDKSQTGWRMNLSEVGKVTTSSDFPSPERLAFLHQSVADLLEHFAPTWVVVETPASRGRPPGAQNFSSTLLSVAQYAMAVGVVLAAAMSPFRMRAGQAVRIEPPRLLVYPSDEWTRRGVPGTKNDPYKLQRVQYAATVFDRPIPWFGAKSVAGNCADAALLARYAINREEMATGQRLFADHAG